MEKLKEDIQEMYESFAAFSFRRKVSFLKHHNGRVKRGYYSGNVLQFLASEEKLPFLNILMEKLKEEIIQEMFGCF